MHAGLPSQSLSFPDPTSPLSIVVDQTLTRFSISRNSRREMTHSFLSRAGEVNFHFSFSSRFSRFWEKNSLSFLVSQDSFIEFLFLLSIFKILQTNFSFSSRLWDLDIEILFLFSIFKICQANHFLLSCCENPIFDCLRCLPLTSVWHLSIVGTGFKVKGGEWEGVLYILIWFCLILRNCMLSQIFTPACKYFYTDISVISVTFCNSGIRIGSVHLFKPLLNHFHFRPTLGLLSLCQLKFVIATKKGFTCDRIA